MSPPAEFESAVETVLGRLRPGEVVSYGEVAEQAGFPGAARAVGSILRRARPGLPWWRVVSSDGYLRAPDRDRQAALLAAEGVEVHGGRVRGPY